MIINKYIKYYTPVCGRQGWTQLSITC